MSHSFHFCCSFSLDVFVQVFDKDYKKDFLKEGLLDRCHGELQHLISDAATMQIIRWTHGGFGMAAHNYDGDMLTDEISQVLLGPVCTDSVLSLCFVPEQLMDNLLAPLR